MHRKHKASTSKPNAYTCGDGVGLRCPSVPGYPNPRSPGPALQGPTGSPEPVPPATLALPSFPNTQHTYNSLYSKASINMSYAFKANKKKTYHVLLNHSCLLGILTTPPTAISCARGIQK